MSTYTTTYCGLLSIKHLDPQIQELVSHSVKNGRISMNSKLRSNPSWYPDHCPSRLCKNYISQLGFIYIYIYICIYIYIYIDIYLCVYMYMYICICIYVYVYVCIYVFFTIVYLQSVRCNHVTLLSFAVVTINLYIYIFNLYIYLLIYLCILSFFFFLLS